VALNRECDKATAEQIIGIFTEAVIAPSFTEDAVETLKAKPNLRILPVGEKVEEDDLWIEKVSGGFLVQERDNHHLKLEDLKVVTKKQPTQAELEELQFAWNVVKHVKSNAIVITKDKQTLGVGAGQMNRVGSVGIAMEEAGEKSKGAVLASDAYFPFADSIEKAHEAGITAIIQPGGSIRDEEVIEACDKYGIAMVFTGIRHFRH